VAGVLQFTLGLEASKFLGQIQHAAGSLGHLFLSGIEGAFETGARLEHLSKRTGQSVSDLYALEKGFKAVGLSGDSVSTVLFQMNKAMGGFSEFGTPTKDIFASMGLDIEKLKGMGAKDALLEISGALAQLGNAEATKAGSLIFGRGGAADAMQFARSLEEGTTAMRGAAQLGSLYERNGEAFAKIERTIEQIKNKGKGLFAGIAEGAAPGVQALLDMLNKIDLKDIGQNIGNILGSVVGAFRGGELGNVVFLSMASAFERVSMLIANPAFWEGLSSALFAATNIGGGIIRSIVVNSKAAIAAINDPGAMTKDGKIDPDLFAGSFKKNKARLNLVADRVDADLRDEANAAMQDALAKLGPAIKGVMSGRGGPASQQLAELLDKFKMTFDPAEHGPTKKLLENVSADKTKAAHQAAADSLTRIGAFSGNPNAQAEHMKQAAANTRNTVAVLNKILAAVLSNPLNPITFSNQ